MVDLKDRLQQLEVGEVEETGKELGRGSYGIIVELKVKGLRCVGKKLHQFFFETRDQEKNAIMLRFVDECLRHSELRHPNIVQFIGIHFTPGNQIPILVMELMHLSLASALEQCPNIPSRIKSSILLDVSLGLHYLHTQTPPVIHRDLTAKNVLLSESMRAKIADLGVARIVDMNCAQMSLRMTTTPGTPCYMPPEAFVAEPVYDTKLDVFSLGNLILHVSIQDWPIPLTGIVCPHPDLPGQFVAITEVERRVNYLDRMGESHPLWSLTTRCLQNDPRLRPTTTEIVKEIHVIVTNESTPYINNLQMLYDIHSKVEEIESLQKEIEVIESSKKQEIEVFEFKNASLKKENAFLRNVLAHRDAEIATLKKQLHVEQEAKRERTTYENVPPQKEMSCIDKVLTTCSGETLATKNYPENDTTEEECSSEWDIQSNITEEVSTQARNQEGSGSIGGANESLSQRQSVVCEISTRNSEYYNLVTRDESEPPQLCHDAEDMSSTLDAVDATADVTVQTNADCIEDQSLQHHRPKEGSTYQQQESGVLLGSTVTNTQLVESDKKQELGGSSTYQQQENGSLVHDPGSVVTNTQLVESDKKQELGGSTYQQQENGSLVHDPGSTVTNTQLIESDKKQELKYKDEVGRSCDEHCIWASGTNLVATYNFAGTSSLDLPFKKGDTMVVVSATVDPNWCKVRRYDGRVGLIPCNHVAEAMQSQIQVAVTNTDQTRLPVNMKGLQWFHGHISRKKTEKLLKPLKDGKFLVRDNNNFKGDYTLCISHNGQVNYYRVRSDKRGCVSVDQDVYFENLAKLVEHHQRVADGLCCLLKYPIENNNEGIEHKVTLQDFQSRGWAIPRSAILNKPVAVGEKEVCMLGEFQGQNVAIRVSKSDKEDPKAEELLLREAAMMTNLRHPNLVALIGVSVDEYPPCLITEHMEKGPLLYHLRACGKHMILKRDLLSFAKDICKGMIYIESQNFVHRDLCAENVEISDKSVAKISRLEKVQELHSKQNTGADVSVKWAAPEALKQKQFSNKSDVWSFGVFLWEMYSFGQIPYFHLPEKMREILAYLQAGKRMMPPVGCPGGVYHVMTECWKWDATLRPNFVQIETLLDAL